MNIPDRLGWLDEPLASYPSTPPFPQLTSFERKALATLAPLFGAGRRAFEKQVEACQAVDRVDTKVDFFTRITVDRSFARPLPIRGKGGHFDVEGIAMGLSVVLWDDDDGYLPTIEGVTYGDADLGGRSLVDLQFLGYQPT